MTIDVVNRTLRVSKESTPHCFTQRSIDTAEIKYIQKKPKNLWQKLFKRLRPEPLKFIIYSSKGKKYVRAFQVHETSITYFDERKFNDFVT